MKYGRKPFFYHSIVVVLSLTVIGWNCDESLNKKGINQKHDAVHQVRYAYNLAHNRAFTRKMNKDGTAASDAYREPLFAVYMALTIVLDDTLSPLSIKQLMRGSNAIKLRRWQIPVLLATALLAFGVVFAISGSAPVAHLALLLTGFSGALNSSVYYLTTEHHAAFWVLLLSFALFASMKTMKRRYFIAAGGIAGVLVLHKASFMFVIWPILGLFFLVGRAQYMEKKQLLLNLVFTLLAFAIITGGWMIRNYGQYGTFFLTHRGGNVLAIREAYNRMNDDEFKGAFLYWAPDPLFKTLLKERYGADALKKGKILGKLNRSNGWGYYRLGRHQRNKVLREYGKNTPFTDAIVKNAALGRIKKAPWRHIRAMAPLFWRSIFVESGFELRRPLHIAVQGRAMVSILLVTLFFIAFIVALRRRQWAVFGFLFPGFYLMALNVAVSHCLPRYNQPLIPVFIIAALLLGTRTLSLLAPRCVSFR